MKQKTRSGIIDKSIAPLALLGFIGLITLIVTLVDRMPPAEDVSLNYILFIPSAIIIYLFMEFFYIDSERNNKKRDIFAEFLANNLVLLVTSLLVSNGIVGAHNFIKFILPLLIGVFPFLQYVLSNIFPYLIGLGIIILIKYFIYDWLIVNYPKPKARKKKQTKGVQN